MTVQEPTGDDEQERRRAERARVADGLAAIMCGISCGGGYLLGVLTTALGAPAGVHAPLLLGCTALTWVYLRRPWRRR